MARYRKHNSGTSLLELLAVVTLMGIFATVVIARLGPTVFGNVGSDADARRLGLALLQAKRSAITSGLNHGVILNAGSGNYASFSVVKLNADSSQTVVDGPWEFTREVQVTSTQGSVWFNFEGQSTAPATITLRGSVKTYQINVTPVSGGISTVQSAGS